MPSRRFRKDDPLRYLHVPKGERLDEDGGDYSDAVDEVTGEADDDFDRDAVRARGRVFAPEDLQ